jgi:hypothetical protein
MEDSPLSCRRTAYAPFVGARTISLRSRADDAARRIEEFE